MNPWYPGAPTTGDYYPNYTGGYSPPISDAPTPAINSRMAPSVNAQSLSTVLWGLALLGAAFILMHVTDRG